MLLDDSQRPICLVPGQRYANLLVSTVKTVQNTHNSAHFSTGQFYLPGQYKDRKRLKIFDSNKVSLNQQQQSTPIARIGGLRFKTVNSDDLNDSDKKNQPFFQSQKHVRNCTSQEKTIGQSSITRRHKIFDKNYCARVNEAMNQSPIHCNSNNQIEEDSTRNLVQKLQMMFPRKNMIELKESFYMREKPLQEQFKSVICDHERQPHANIISMNNNIEPCRLHSTPNTIFPCQSAATNQRKQITFTYQSRSQLPPHYTPLKAHPLANSYNIPALNIHQGVTNNAFPRLFAESHVAEYVNPATYKIKDRIINKSTSKQSSNQNYKKGGQENDIKVNLALSNKNRPVFQKNQFVQQATVSKTSAQLKDSLIRSGARLTNHNIQTARSSSNVEEDNTERYFDDENIFPVMAKRISYKNIDIIKKEEESEEEPEIDPRNLFIDFEASRRKSMEKQSMMPSFASKASINHEGMMILSNSTLEILQPKEKQGVKMQNVFPRLLILLAVLLLIIQMIR